MRYRALFEESPDGIVLFDLETCLPVEFNASACDHTGYSREEFGQLRICDHQACEAPGQVTACVSKILREGGRRYEIKHRTKEKEIRHVVLLAQPITLSNQSLLHCVFRDVTEQKAARLALQESQQQFRDLVETTSDWIWGIDQRGVFDYCSPKVEDLLGYEPEEVVGKKLWDLTLPSEAEGFAASVHKCMTSAAPIVRLERTSLHKDGRHVVLETNAAPVVDADGRLFGYRGVDRDITEVKEAYDLLRERERRYHQLLAAVTSYAYSVKVENGVSVATKHGEGCVSVTGYRPEDYEFDVSLWHSMIHPDDQEMVGRQVARALAGEEVPPIEHRILRRDRTTRWIRNTMIVHCENGTLVRYDGLIEDITERKRAEGALRDRELQLLTAQTIQKGLLPSAAPESDEFEIAGVLHPAEFAAGDYFDYLPMADGGLGVAIGDVTGHGFGPALIMASTHTVMRMLAETHNDVAEILTAANSVLVREIEEDRFVTVLLARLNPTTRTMVYSNGGHPPGYVFNSAGEVRVRLPATNIPLGIVPDLEFSTGEPVALEPGDTVVLLSDGILESASPEGDFFGVERTLETIRTNLHRTAGEMAEILCQAARDFSGKKEPSDDTTTVVIKVKSDWTTS